MAGVTLTFILLAVFLGASSIPLPDTQVSSVSTTPVPPAADAAPPHMDLVIPRDPSPKPASPAPAPSQLAVTSPIGFGDLNAPSEGASFTDFAVTSGKRDSIALVPSKHDIIKARAPSVHGKKIGRKRSFQPGTEAGGAVHGHGRHGQFGGPGLGFNDVFKAKGKGAKAAKAPATAPGKAAQAPQAAAAAAPPANTVAPSADDDDDDDDDDDGDDEA